MSNMRAFRAECPLGRPPLLGLGHHIVKILGLVVSLLVSVAAPAQGQSWVATGRMNVERVNHTATLLTDSRVLVTGGLTPAGILTPTAEIHDPGTGSWTMTGSMSVARSGHTATALTVVHSGERPAASEYHVERRTAKPVAQRTDAVVRLELTGR